MITPKINNGYLRKITIWGYLVSLANVCAPGVPSSFSCNNNYMIMHNNVTWISHKPYPIVTVKVTQSHDHLESREN